MIFSLVEMMGIFVMEDFISNFYFFDFKFFSDVFVINGICIMECR